MKDILGLKADWWSPGIGTEDICLNQARSSIDELICLRAPRRRAYSHDRRRGCFQAAGALRAAALRRAAACSRRPSRDGQGWMAGDLDGACWGCSLGGRAVVTEARAWRRQAGRGAAHADRSEGAVAGHDRLKRAGNLSPRDSGGGRYREKPRPRGRAAGSSGGGAAQRPRPGVDGG